MFEAAAPVSGIGFAPIDYVGLWSTPARPSVGATPTNTTASASSLWSTPARQPTATGAFSTPAASTSLFAPTTQIDLEVELSIARLRAAAEQVLRNRAAQLSAGGAAVRGGAAFAYTLGPDGQLYATGVTLTYDTSPVPDNPQATILKMQQVRAAALATATPAAADLAAAARATQLELEARLALVQESAALYLGSDDPDTVPAPGALLEAEA